MHRRQRPQHICSTHSEGAASGTGFRGPGRSSNTSTVKDICYLPEVAGSLLFLTGDLSQKMKTYCWNLQHCFEAANGGGGEGGGGEGVCSAPWRKKGKRKLQGRLYVMAFTHSFAHLFS